MVVKALSALHLLPVRDAAKGFLISLKASNRYSPGYLDRLEETLGQLAEFAEEQSWPSIELVTTVHLESYLASLQTRRRWFGERPGGTSGKPISQSYIETQYRRVRRYFNWLVERGHVERNPLDLIPHPHIDEKVVQTVSEQEMVRLVARTDPQFAKTASERFRMVRDRAMLYLLVDTPGRRSELVSLTLGAVDLDVGAILVLGKGRRERWMPLGAVAVEALWEYLLVRGELAKNTTGETGALWLDTGGRPMSKEWLRHMLRRLGDRAGVPNLHPHRFRHSYAVNALRAKMPERILMLNGGWKKIPATYFRTLGADDVARFHREMSPADRLARAPMEAGPGLKRRKVRGRL